MMNMISPEPAKITLKDGSQTTGLLLNNINDPSSFETGIHFVPNSRLDEWLQELNRAAVNILDPLQIESIDVYMK